MASGMFGTILMLLGRFGEKQSRINWVRVRLPCFCRTSFNGLIARTALSCLISSVPRHLVRMWMMSSLGAGEREDEGQILHCGSLPLSLARVA